MQMRLKMSLVEGTLQAGKSQIDRKKVGKRKNVCRWAATMLKGVVMSVALLGTVSAARAGTWAETSRVYDGEDKRQIGTQPTQTTPWYPQGYGLGGYAGVFEYPSGQSGFVSRGGTITSTWTWSPRRITDPNGNGYDKIDDPSDTLPDELILKVYTRANATAASNTNYPSSSSYRDTAKETVSASVTGDTEGAVTDNGSSKSALALAIRLVKVPTNGSRTVSLVSSTQATATVMGNRYPSQDGSSSSAPGYVNVGIGFSIAKDTRGVTLSRVGAPAAKHASDSTLDAQRDEWIAADGTGYGHSVYSYEAKECVPASDCALTHYVWQTNNQMFNAARAGSWSSNLTWQWTPSDSSDTISTHPQEMPAGSLYDSSAFSEVWGGTSTGQTQKIITYDLIDNADGAKARAKYVLTLHDPYEVRAGSPAQTITPKSYFFPTRLYSSNEATATSDKNVSWDVTLEGNITLNFNSSLGLSHDALTNLGIGVGFEGNATLKVTASGSGSTTIAPGKKSYPYFDYEIATRHFLIDKWNASGQVENSSRPDGSWTSDEDRLLSVTPRWSPPINIGATEEGD